MRSQGCVVRATRSSPTRSTPSAGSSLTERFMTSRLNPRIVGDVARHPHIRPRQFGLWVSRQLGRARVMLTYSSASQANLTKSMLCQNAVSAHVLDFGRERFDALFSSLEFGLQSSCHKRLSPRRISQVIFIQPLYFIRQIDRRPTKIDSMACEQFGHQ